MIKTVSTQQVLPQNLSAPIDAMDLELACVACPSLQVAQQIGQSLICERLAACVNILPEMNSIYEWDSTVTHAKEVLLLAKTHRFEALKSFVVSQHPYELPAIFSLRVQSIHEPYAQWVYHQSQKPKIRKENQQDETQPPRDH